MQRVFAAIKLNVAVFTEFHRTGTVGVAAAVRVAVVGIAVAVVVGVVGVGVGVGVGVAVFGCMGISCGTGCSNTACGAK